MKASARKRRLPRTTKKKEAELKQPKVAPVSSLEDIGERSLKASHGDDAHNPVLWLLIVARDHLKTCRVLDADKPLASALFERSVRRDGLHTRGAIQLGFFEAAARAVIEGNASFFVEVARLLTHLSHPLPVQQAMDEAVFQSFRTLERRNDGLPTKKQVRDMAETLVATDRALRHIKWRFITDIYEPAGKSGLRWKPKIQQEIDKEYTRLPVTNWTVVFKRCGLARLPSNKGGQPSHKKRSYYR